MRIERATWWGLGCLLAFVGLALAVVAHAGWLQAADAACQTALATTLGTGERATFAAIAVLGSPAVAIGVTAVLAGGYWLRQQRGTALWLAGTQVIGAAVLELCKLAVRRPRPTRQLVADTGFSFPSGHVLCLTLLVLALLSLVLPRVKDQEVQLVIVLVGLVWVCLVAFSRVYLRDHFGSDVVGSLLLAGGLWLTVLRPTGWLRRVAVVVSPVRQKEGHSHAKINDRDSSL